MGDSGATPHMTRNVNLMYDTRPPPPHRSRIIPGDGSIQKVQFIGKVDLVFHSKTDYPVTAYDGSFVPDLGFNLFFFHVVQTKHEIILNKTGAHLLGGRLVLPRRCHGSSLRATRVLPGRNANAITALAPLQSPLPTVLTCPLPPYRTLVWLPPLHTKINQVWVARVGQGMQLPESAGNILVKHGKRVENPKRCRVGRLGWLQLCFPLVVYLQTKKKSRGGRF